MAPSEDPKIKTELPLDMGNFVNILKFLARATAFWIVFFLVASTLGGPLGSLTFILTSWWVAVWVSVFVIVYVVLMAAAAVMPVVILSAAFLALLAVVKG